MEGHAELWPGKIKTMDISCPQVVVVAPARRVFAYIEVAHVGVVLLIAPPGGADFHLLHVNLPHLQRDDHTGCLVAAVGQPRFTPYKLCITKD